MTQVSANRELEKLLKFSELAISAELKKGIKELGYVTPTSFQIGMLDNFQRGKNVVGEGQSNYGKSLAFLLPILAKIDTEKHEIQALIICETILQSELCAKECRALGRHLNIEVKASLEALNPNDKEPHILVLVFDDFVKSDMAMLSSLHTVFIDSLSFEKAKKTLDQLSSSKLQFLIFGKETIAAFNENAKDLFEHAVFINNSDQPKVAILAKHIFHQPKETEPKPRALLAALELHKPKFALVTCNEAQECDLLARFLARYGFKVRIVSEENNRQGIESALHDGVLGLYDVLLCQSSSLFGHSLENIEFMINYDMLERPHAYEQVTQFSKQAMGIERLIVNILTNREIGSLGPIKAQCLIDFSEVPLPLEDEVMSLCAKEIVKNLNKEASDVELAQFETIAQKIFSDENSRPALALLLRNYLLQFDNNNKNELPNNDDNRRGSNRFSNDRKRLEPRDRNLRAKTYEAETNADFSVNHVKNNQDSMTRLYITLGKRDGFLDLASLAQYLSEKSHIDLGHFTGSGMLRDQSAHIEVDSDVASDIIKSIHNSPRPNLTSTENEEILSHTVICEKARATMSQRPNRRVMPQRRRPPYHQRRQMD